jgi:pyruvate kinase
VRRNRKVKILATLGPASSSQEMIEKLFVAGVDVFRINMSHTNHDLLKTLYGHIRAVEAKLGRPIGVLCDLQGPKIRIDTFADKEVRIPTRRPATRSACTCRILKSLPPPRWATAFS